MYIHTYTLVYNEGYLYTLLHTIHVLYLPASTCVHLLVWTLTYTFWMVRISRIDSLAHRWCALPLCWYVCSCMYMYTRIHTYVCMYMYTHIHTYVCMHKYTHVDLMCTWNVYTLARIWRALPPCWYVCILTCIYTHIHLLCTDDVFYLPASISVLYLYICTTLLVYMPINTCLWCDYNIYTLWRTGIVLYLSAGTCVVYRYVHTCDVMRT